jgi:hypothetical protein
MKLKPILKPTSSDHSAQEQKPKKNVTWKRPDSILKKGNTESTTTEKKAEKKRLRYSESVADNSDPRVPRKVLNASITQAASILERWYQNLQSVDQAITKLEQASKKAFSGLEKIAAKKLGEKYDRDRKSYNKFFTCTAEASTCRREERYRDGIHGLLSVVKDLNPETFSEDEGIDLNKQKEMSERLENLIVLLANDAATHTRHPKDSFEASTGNPINQGVAGSKTNTDGTIASKVEIRPPTSSNVQK